jgi:hypothetical protein
MKGKKIPSLFASLAANFVPIKTGRGSGHMSSSFAATFSPAARGIYFNMIAVIIIFPYFSAVM